MAQTTTWNQNKQVYWHENMKVMSLSLFLRLKFGRGKKGFAGHHCGGTSKCVLSLDLGQEEAGPSWCQIWGDPKCQTPEAKTNFSSSLFHELLRGSVRWNLSSKVLESLSPFHLLTRSQNSKGCHSNAIELIFSPSPLKPSPAFLRQVLRRRSERQMKFASHPTAIFSGWVCACVCWGGGVAGCVCVHAQFCLTLWDPMDCRLPDSSVQGIFQARILEWVAISSSRGSSWPRDWTRVSCLGRKHSLPLHHLGWQEMDTITDLYGHSLYVSSRGSVLLNLQAEEGEYQPSMWPSPLITPPYSSEMALLVA